MGEEASSSLDGVRFLLLLPVLVALVLRVETAKVTYDHRALIIDGRRRVLISGSIHYPRSSPEMWPGLIEKSKDGGLDVIETYVFWNLHEPAQGQYDFSGEKDLVKFLKTVAAAGLYAHLRIGPYVCAEWNFGGFPLWLHFIPGIEFRTDNDPFKTEMRRFTGKIVDMMKKEMLFASQGGPIILTQIENEYGNVQWSYGSAAKAYVDWAASMAVAQATGVPWVMCQQADAPDPIINTCNGFYCDQFTPNSPQKPKMWTENWSGWFLMFGGTTPHRPVQDLAFSVARFFQRGGTFQNYYMYHGGTNFGRSAGGPFIATSYDYDAPIDEYGMRRQPKWGHLRDLHRAIKLCEEALLASDPSYRSLGQNLEAHTYEAGTGSCAAFLANIDPSRDAVVTFEGNSYHLPAWSVSILPDCKNVVFNSAQINAQAASLEMRRISPPVPESKSLAESSSQGLQSEWSSIDEAVGAPENNAISTDGLLEQINATADVSDYLWYSTRVNITGDEQFLVDGNQAVLRAESLGHVLHAFVNGEIAGSGFGSASHAKITLEKTIKLVRGMNNIDFLSATVGLQNYGAFFEKNGAGMTGPVKLKGNNGATTDLSKGRWSYQIGLRGEEQGLHEGSTGMWSPLSSSSTNKPLVWYKTTFDSPRGDDPVAVDLTGMGKGEAWVNGRSLGRFWPAYSAPSSGCADSCDYRGNYRPEKCAGNCGKPSQSLYHVPRSFLREDGRNDLVLFEEVGGDPTRISLAVRQLGKLCGLVSQLHPPPLHPKSLLGPVLLLECPHSDQIISSVEFASFGTPLGKCGSFRHGACHSENTLAVVEKGCAGKKSCSLDVSSVFFGDPCHGVVKSLAVQVTCA